MSPSEASPSEAHDQEARAAVSVLEKLAEHGELSAEGVCAVVSAVTRLYATASARAGAELTPVGPGVSTTDALTLACALVRSQDLTPFEMAVWFSRGERH
jgi:hypothetical protein